MKAIGIGLILLGVVWASIAFNADTSVETGGKTIGRGEFQIDIPQQRVNNLGLMDERRNHLMFAGLTILVGVILVGFGSVTGKRSAETTDSRACPFCAELIKAEAKVCRYCQRDLQPEAPHDTEGGAGLTSGTIAPTVVTICGSCRATNTGGVEKCFRCGHVLEGPATLHDAVWNGNWATASRLLGEGADVSKINAEGKTALDLARERGDKQMINLLLSSGAVESHT